MSSEESTIEDAWPYPFCRMYLEEISDSSNSRNRTGISSNITVRREEIINSNEDVEALPNIFNVGGVSEALPLNGPRIADDKLVWFQVLLPIVCTLGISGNLLNLVILTRKRFCAPMGKLEQSANMGMIALALSDMLFCLTVFPHSFMDNIDLWHSTYSWSTELFILYYKVYGISLINLFIMSSTWLIVTLAMERYIVLYYPLQAKISLTRHRSIYILILVYMTCCLLTMPYFLYQQVRPCMTDEVIKHEVWYRFAGSTYWSMFLQVYIRHIWPVIAVFLPQMILFVCNVRLIQGLRTVQNIRRVKCPGQNIRDVNNKITLTLIIIVAMAIVLVTPAEILKAVNPYVLWGETGYILASVANLLQTLNFAFNFVLYCAIDRHFRHTCRGLFLCQCSAHHPGNVLELGTLMNSRRNHATSCSM